MCGCGGQPGRSQQGTGAPRSGSEGPLIQASVRGNRAVGEERRCSCRGLWKGAVQSRKAVAGAWPRPHSPEDPAGDGKGAPSTQQLGLWEPSHYRTGPWNVPGVIGLRCPADPGAVAPGRSLQTRVLSVRDGLSRPGRHHPRRVSADLGAITPGRSLPEAVGTL